MERPKTSFRKFFSTRRKNDFVGSKDDLFEMKRSMSVFDRLKQFSRRKDRSKDTENNIRFELIFTTKDTSESLMYNFFYTVMCSSLQNYVPKSFFDTESLTPKTRHGSIPSFIVLHSVGLTHTNL